MAEIERLVRDTLDEEAQRSPSGVGLLPAVHARSRQLARRRRTGGAAVVVVGALAAVAGFLVVDPSGGAAPVRVVAATGTPTTPSASVSIGPATQVTSPSRTPSASGSATAGTTALTLSAPLDAAVAFPYLLDPTVAGRMHPNPTVTLVKGVLQAAYEARDGERDADITLTVSPVEPRFPPASAPVRETPQRVRGHQGTLRTVDLRPAAEITLTWQQRPGQWVQLRTDDTYRDRQVVTFAEGLAPGRLSGAAEFAFATAPAGATLTTSTASGVGFGVRGQDGPAALTVTLLTPRPLSGAPVRVAGRPGAVSSDASGTHLLVDVPDRGAVLRVSVPAGYTLAPGDLVRFAAGIHVSRQAVPTDRPLDG